MRFIIVTIITFHFQMSINNYSHLKCKELNSFIDISDYP